MTALFSTRRRAEEFAAAVDAAAERPARDLDQELGALVGVATLLREHPEARAESLPRDTFAADLRARLLAEADDVLVPGTSRLLLPARTGSRRERRLVAAASAVVLIGGSAGMAAAAQQALPGEALYPIKRGIERAEAGLSVTTAGKGRDLLAQASDRLAEVEGLLAADSVTATPQIPGTLTDFTTQAQEGSALLLDAFEQTRDAEDIVAVREFTSEGIALLERLAGRAPAESRAQLVDAATMLGDIDARAMQLCGTCSDMPALQLPAMFLAAAEVNRAFAKVDPDSLDNSHPVEVPTTMVKRSGDSAKKGKKSDGDSGAPGTPEAPDTPSTPEDPDPSGGLELPRLGKPDPDAGGGLTSDLGDPVGGVVEGLSDGVATLLPETSDQLDLP